MMLLDTLKSKIIDREAKIMIVGLGYVGLPLAIAFAKAGFNVIGTDVDESKLESIRTGESYLRHVQADEFMPYVESGKLIPGPMPPKGGFDVAIVCVPTPLDEHRSPNLGYVKEAMRDIGYRLKHGCLVSLESTTYPGTTAGMVKETLEWASTMKAGEDFFLVYTPERQDPGNPIYGVSNTPKVIGGHTMFCLDAGKSLYSEVMDKVVPVSSTDTAEMVKIFENVYRMVNISLVNELKLLCDKLGVDTWEVVRAAATKPFGFQPFYPGPGIGGHCLPVDAFYLTWRARQAGMSTQFIELAGEINTAMPEYVVSKVQDALNDHEKCLNRSKVLLLGVAYKPDVSDTRESPALKIMDLLKERGADVGYYDPHVQSVDRGHTNYWSALDLLAQDVAGYDCVVLVTDHSGIDYEMVAKHAELIVDTRGRFPVDADNVYQA